MYGCLQDFCSFLECTDMMESIDVTPQEAGIRCLALRSKLKASDHQVFLSKISPKTRICYFQWLLAYVGQQQIHGRLPFFPDQESVVNEISGENKEIILTCKSELELLLMTFETTRLAKEIFPDAVERQMPLLAVPTACVLLLLYINALAEVKQGNRENKKGLNLKYIDLLIQCHHAMSKALESRQEPSADEMAPRSKIWNRKSYSLNKIDDSDLEELEYLAELNQKLFALISSTSPEALSKLPKDTLLKCESDLRAAISYKLKCK